MVSVTLAMFQLLMSWLKEVAKVNIPAHAHTRRKHGEAAGPKEESEEGCRGAGRDAQAVMLMSWLKEVAP